MQESLRNLLVNVKINTIRHAVVFDGETGCIDPFMLAGVIRSHLAENLGGSTIGVDDMGNIDIVMKRSGLRFAANGRISATCADFWAMVESVFGTPCAGWSIDVPRYSERVRQGLMRRLMQATEKKKGPVEISAANTGGGSSLMLLG